MKKTSLADFRNEKAENINTEGSDAFSDLERCIYAALETYSNVHRGSGHKSMVTTFLFEKARQIVLDHLRPGKGRYIVIFCTPAREAVLISKIKPGSYKKISSRDIGLPLGVIALAVRRNALPGGTPFQTGGGTTRLVAPDWVVWANGPDRFEAGTPAILNIITFARALQIISHAGKEVFINRPEHKPAAREILYHDDLEDYSGKNLLAELKNNIIGYDVMVPTTEGSSRYINLDNGASTPTFKPVWETYRQTLRQQLQVQQEIINEVRVICAEVLAAPLSVYDVIFTSNTTEAINLAAESLNNASTGKESEPVVINTLIEHNSNDLPWRMYPGISLMRLKTTGEGFINKDELEAVLCEYNKDLKHGKKRIRLVAVSGASNVLGIFNDLEEISIIVHKYGAHLLVDSAQLVAHRRVEIEKCDIDYFAFSAHKLYAPFGTGVLVARKGLLNFSKEEKALIKSSGEENAAGIAAMGKALLLLQRTGFDLIREEEQELTKRALLGLSQIEGVRMYGISDPDSPQFSKKGGVIVFDLNKTFSNVVANNLALRGGIGIRFGCHCAHILIKHLVGVGPVLERFQHLMARMFPVGFPGLARISLGIGNTEADIDKFLKVMHDIAIHPAIKTSAAKRQVDDFTKAVAAKVFPAFKDPAA